MPTTNIYIYIYTHTHTHEFSKRFYPKRLTLHSGYTFFCQYVCSLGIEPTTFALLTQCSTTEPQEHMYVYTHTHQSPFKAVGSQTFYTKYHLRKYLAFQVPPYDQH